MDWLAYERQCYLLARDQKQFLADGSFNEKVSRIFGGLSNEEQEKGLRILEQMITHSARYEEAQRRFAPILILLPDGTCYGILRHFAQQLATALTALGESVEYFEEEQPLEELPALRAKTYKAILGVQTFLFSLKLVNGELLFDSFDAPLYNMQFDHPVVMHRHLLHAPGRLCVLHHDRDYAAFVERWYSKRIRNRMLRPAGDSCKDPAQKQYDLSFMGTYQDWRSLRGELKALNRTYHGLARILLGEMKQNPNATYEACFVRAARKHAQYDDTDADTQLAMLFALKTTYLAVMYYYREKVVDTLLREGIAIHVFGDSWRSPHFTGSKQLFVHPQQGIEESLHIYAKSKLSLNIMSWHKDGMTERIANSMLCHAVVISDKSRYLEENFKDNEEIVLFDLTRIGELPQRIKALLSDDARRERIAEKAYDIAKNRHTWANRAEQLLAYITEDRNCPGG